jgi:hypothetical protein
MGIIKKGLETILENTMENSYISPLIVFVGLPILAIGTYDVLSKKFYEDKMKSLDQQGAQIFTSVEDCQSKGMKEATCRDSFREAQSVDSNLDFSYGSSEDCESQHGKSTCRKIAPSTAMMPYTNQIVIMHSTVHKPRMAAWQAATANMRQAVPLYPSAQGANIVVRKDGAMFNLDK